MIKSIRPFINIVANEILVTNLPNVHRHDRLVRELQLVVDMI
jgi:hypothetical protein